MKSHELDPTERKIINSNRGISNTVDLDEQRKYILSLLDRFTKIMINHCGPSSHYAMIINAQSAGIQFEPNIFTKDGIDILSSVECMAPIENYIRELVCYLGSRVDSAAKDGTTTSILYALKLLRAMTASKMVNTSSTYLRKKIADAVITKILERWSSQYIIHIEDLLPEESNEQEIMNMAGNIAFMQAMSSSGGDIELACAMKKIYSHSPRISWDFIDYYQNASENSKRFTVEIDEYDCAIRCVTALSGIMNKSLGSEYEVHDAKCLVLTDSFVDNDIRMDSLLFYLKNLDKDTPFVILTSYVPAKLVAAAASCNTERNAKISVWQYSAGERLAGQAFNWELLIPNAIAGITPYDHASVPHETEFSDQYTFTAKKVIWKNTYLEFYGTIEPVKGSVLHPYYLHPETATPFYQEVVDELQRQRKQIQECQVKNQKLVSIFTELLNRVTCLHRPKLRLGGPMHEQVANIPVVKDVQGAIMSSLKDGFTVNGACGILRILTDINAETNYNEDDTSYNAYLNMNSKDASMNYTQYITHILASAGADLYNSVLCNDINDGSSPEYYYNELVKYIPDTAYTDKSDLHTYLDILEQSENALDKPLNILSDQEEYKGQYYLTMNYPVLQPARVVYELFKRVQELLLKFSDVSEIIVRGGMLIKEAENTSDTKNKKDGE